jgi:serine phosphatase RsbU (regulator of sigma subunit)
VERYEGFERWSPVPAPAPDGHRADVRPTVSAQWLEALYQSPTLFSGLLDPDGRVVDGNWLSIEGCGFAREDIVGRPFWECGWWSPDVELAGRIRRWCAKAVAAGEALSVVSRYHRGDGSSGMVDLGLVPLVGGSAGDFIVVTGLDISEVLAAQASREDRFSADAAASRHAEARLRAGLDAIIDNVTIAHSIRDEAGEIVDFEIDFVNQVSADGAGRSAAELIGGRVCELYPTWRESGMFDRFARVVDDGATFVGERLLYEDVLADGTVIDGYWDIHVAKLDDGYIAASRDVTDIVRNEVTARAAALRAERERLAIEILQDAALSVELPALRGVDIGVHYQPAERDVPIGGDWYDVLALADGRVVFIIADVAGHGPTSAGFMVQLRNILRAITVEDAEPAAVLRRANNVVVALHRDRVAYATCCVATLTPSSGELVWSLAGHPPPLLVAGDGDDRFVDGAPGPPLGVVPGVDFGGGRTRLERGDRLVMYTDGLVETRHESLDEGMRRLRLASRAGRDLDPGPAAGSLAAGLSAGDDDVALIVIDITERPGQPGPGIDGPSAAEVGQGRSA